MKYYRTNSIYRLRHFFIGILVVGATGCASVEHSRAVRQGDAPWYVVKATSLDADIMGSEMIIYKLRKARSTEEKANSLESSKQWGEGHIEIAIKNGGAIRSDARISWDASDPKVCFFQVSGLYLENELSPMIYFESKRVDQCEKAEFKNPYLSGRIQIGGHKWITIDFHFRRSAGD